MFSAVNVILCMLLMIGVQSLRDNADSNKKLNRAREIFRDMHNDPERKMWKDPYDMLGSDSSTEELSPTNISPTVEKKDRSEKDKSLQTDVSPTSPENLPVVGAIYESAIKSCVPSDLVFLSRWLKIIYNKLNRRSFFDFGESKVITFKITKTKINQIKKVLDSEIPNMKDIEDLMADSLTDMSMSNDVSWFSGLFSNIFQLQDVAMLFMAIVSVTLLTLSIFQLARHPVQVIITLSFISTWCWHWMKLYKEAIAAKHARLEQTDVSSACYSKNVGVLGSMMMYLKSYFVYPGDCEEFYKSSMVDPIFDVSPGKAFIDAMSTIVFVPLEKFSYYLNKCIKRLFFELNWQGQIMAVLVVFFLLLFNFNYTLRLPFIGSIEPGRNNNGNSLTSTWTKFISDIVNVFQSQPLHEQVYIQQNPNNNVLPGEQPPMQALPLRPQPTDNSSVRLEHPQSKSNLCNSPNSRKCLQTANSKNCVVSSRDKITEQEILNNDLAKENSQQQQNETEIYSSPTELENSDDKMLPPQNISVNSGKLSQNDAISSTLLDEYTGMAVHNEEFDNVSAVSSKKLELSLKDTLKLTEE